MVPDSAGRRGQMLKVMTIVGTRPEIIRLSRVIARLDETMRHVLVHTGQNYDYELNEIFFKELGLHRPDYHCEVASNSIGEQLGRILIETEKVLLKERPDAVLILGDTNSALASVVAKRLRIPIYHMEAGNRCFDLNVPEEINRRIVDHVADFNLVYTEHARRHLLAEGIHPRRIYLTGSPMREVLDHYRPGIDASPILDELGLDPDGYVLVSVHREENVDDPATLQAIVHVLQKAGEVFRRPVVVSTHPRTRNRLSALGLGNSTDAGSPIRFLRPFGFLAYNKLQMDAFCTVSDSGTISEEAAILQFPAVTIRNAMERPEALDTGNIIITGLDPDTIIASVDLAHAEHLATGTPTPPFEYNIGNVSQRVTRLILGTARLSNRWHGIDGERGKGGAQKAAVKAQ
jgi:UDP-N-acetylglucosamine 2-epimerase